MSPSLAQRQAFIGAMIQSAAADFLASFSELLRASSLLERRPEAAHANPDVDQSIRKAKWLLAGAIETFNRLAAAVEPSAGAPAAKAPPPRPEIAAITARGVEQGVLVDSPPAAMLVTSLISTRDHKQVVLAFTHQLAKCRKAIDRIDAGSKNLGSKDLALELQATLSAYADNLIRGQYVAYVNRAAPG